MGSGFLIYKCRRCGKLTKRIHVPNGLTAIIFISANDTTPKEWGTMTAHKTDV